MESKHRVWNDNQKQLRSALSNPKNQADYLDLFMNQHATVHSAEAVPAGPVSFEDELWSGLEEEHIRRIPAGFDHSIAWCIWHLARIEDVTMAVLVDGIDQLFDREEWFVRLNTPFRTTGNEMTPAEIAQLSKMIDIPALHAYRNAAAVQTRQIVGRLQPGDMKRKTGPDRIQKLYDIGAIIPATAGLGDYWGGLSVAGLLLMPPTRHNLVHLNEAMKIKKKVIR